MINALKENIPVLCVSTSLIEAGVDISFDVVLRACSGLDSLIQAAGRCNRHDHKKLGELIVVFPFFFSGILKECSAYIGLVLPEIKP